MKRSSLSRRTALKSSGRIKTKTRLRSVNPKAKAKRRACYRKMLRSPEYKAARAEAMERAGNRCEFTTQERAGSFDWMGNLAIEIHRCIAATNLHAHHLRYPKSRPLAASDLLIVCKYHHEWLESLKMHKTRMAS